MVQQVNGLGESANKIKWVNSFHILLSIFFNLLVLLAGLIFVNIYPFFRGAFHFHVCVKISNEFIILESKCLLAVWNGVFFNVLLDKYILKA